MLFLTVTYPRNKVKGPGTLWIDYLNLSLFCFDFESSFRSFSLHKFEGWYKRGLHVWILYPERKTFTFSLAGKCSLWVESWLLDYVSCRNCLFILSCRAHCIHHSPTGQALPLLIVFVASRVKVHLPRKVLEVYCWSAIRVNFNACLRMCWIVTGVFN